MRASVERLRWVLAGAAALLLIVLVVYLGYGHYRAIRAWKDILKRSGVQITHDTNGFTISRSLQGRTIYTVHAAKGIQHGDGRYSLHDAELLLYGKTPKDFDRIYGADFEYDQKTGVVQAPGEVYIDVQAPGALTPQRAGSALAAESPVPQPDGKAGEVHNIIHVRTSGLRYSEEQKVATTSQEVEFLYAGLQCLSRGAVFDSDHSLLHLLADVRLSGEVHGKPMEVHAYKADLDREANTVAMVQPVVQTQDRTARAANVLLHLRTDGSLEQAEAGGGVVFDEGTRHLTAPSLHATFSAASQPQTSKLTGGVVLWDDDPQRPLHGKATEVDMVFNAMGAATGVVAAGEAQVVLNDRSKGTDPALSRELRGDRIVATLVPIGHKSTSRLSQVVVTGSATARGDSLAVQTADHARETKTTTIMADSLRADFATGPDQKAELRKIFGTGHAHLQQDAPLGAQQVSSSDTVDIAFAPQPNNSAEMATEITSAVQNGHVVMHSRPALRAGAVRLDPPSDASANNAIYDGATTKLTLTGAAHFTQGDTALTAATIVTTQNTGDADAQGGVLATLLNTGSTPSRAAAVQVTHVTADRAHLNHASQVVDFYGSEARQARLWQGASQVQAASLRFDQLLETLAARPASAGGLVHAVFAKEAQPKDAGAMGGPGPKPCARQDVPDASRDAKPHGESVGQVIQVASAAMDYTGTAREARFSGGVRIDGTTGQARSQSAVIFLSPAQTATAKSPAGAAPQGLVGQAAPFGGSVQRMVLSGAVRLDQPGRAGTGEQLVYTAADSSYVLTGTPAKPPRMVDANQGNVTGTALLFRPDGCSIIVTGGTPNSAPGMAQPHGRVRTETEVRQ